MKRTLFFSFILTALVPGCTKPSVDPYPVAPIQTFQVLEAVTNKPVEGAKVTLNKCVSDDWLFGCLSRSPIRTLITNKEGKVTYTLYADIEDISIEHPKYWRAHTSYNSDNCFLSPVCTIKASIKKVKSYALDAALVVGVSDATCFDPSCAYTQENTFGLPADTTVFLKGWGYKSNDVSWRVNPDFTAHALPPVYVNGFDTANVQIEY